MLRLSIASLVVARCGALNVNTVSGLDPRWAVAAAPAAATAVAAAALTLAARFVEPESDWDRADPARWADAYGEWGDWAASGLTRRVAASGGAAEVVAARGGGWRLLVRHGKAQSVTAWDVAAGAAAHDKVAHEYVKAMAAAAVGALGRAPTDALYLGLGAGTLPMLLRAERSTAVELDGGAAALARDALGLDGVDVVVGDAADHASLAPGARDLIALDVYGDDDTVPSPFLSEAFARSVDAALADGGAFVANFHVGDGGAEDAKLAAATAAYARVFPSLARIPVRFQGNEILVAVRGAAKPPAGAAAAAAATAVARAEGWRFDPASRLSKLAPASPG